LLRFPRFHSNHHNNKLYGIKRTKDSSVALTLVVKMSDRDALTALRFGLPQPLLPLYFHNLAIALGFLLSLKTGKVRQQQKAANPVAGC
jgi:hypothetical protein